MPLCDIQVIREGLFIEFDYNLEYRSKAGPFNDRTDCLSNKDGALTVSPLAGKIRHVLPGIHRAPGSMAGNILEGKIPHNDGEGTICRTLNHRRLF